MKNKKIVTICVSSMLALIVAQKAMFGGVFLADDPMAQTNDVPINSPVVKKCETPKVSESTSIIKIEDKVTMISGKHVCIRPVKEVEGTLAEFKK